VTVQAQSDFQPKKKGDWYPQTLNYSYMKDHEAWYEEELGSEG
jgi:hypothetical protein